MVYTRLGEPHTLQKPLQWPRPHMFPMLGMFFSAQIINDGRSTLASVSPTPSKKHYHGPGHTRSQCLAPFFLLKLLLRMVYTRLGEPHTLQKPLPWASPHMCAVLGMVFCAEIIIDGWSTLALVSPTPPKNYYGALHTCFQCLASFFLTKSLLRMVYTRLAEAHTPEKTLPWPSPHMFAILGMVVCPQIIIDGWSILALLRPIPPKKHYHGPVHTCSQYLAWFLVPKSLLTDGLHRVGEAHNPGKTLPWPSPHMFAMLRTVFVLK